MKMLQKAVPVYLNVLDMSQESDEFFIYTNVLDQVLVFQRCITDLTPSSTDMAKVMSGLKATPPSSATKKLKPKMNESEEEAFPDPFSTKIPNLSDSYKERILQQARELGDADEDPVSDDADNV